MWRMSERSGYERGYLFAFAKKYSYVFLFCIDDYVETRA